MTDISAGARREAGSPIDFEPGTLVELFLDGVEEHGNREAMLRREEDGTWRSHSFAEVGERVRELALGLRALGYERGERVGTISDTRMEWALADYGMILSGLVNVPVYPSLPAGEAAYILENAGARAAFVEDQEQYDKLVEVRREYPDLERAVSFEPVQASGELPVIGLDELGRKGREADEELAGSYEAYARRAEPDDVVTLIYTSGTTGRPKGVMLTHNNFYSNSLLSARRLPVTSEDRHLSWLPLSHVFERMSGHYLMWGRGVTVAYAESVDTVARDLMDVRPTIMTAVPRLYEKFFEAATQKARAGGALTSKIFSWARSVGEARADRVLAGETVGPWLTLKYAVADRLVFHKIRERTGGEVRYFISGGAPLSPEIAKFFWAASVPVLEGYGLTETSPVLCVNPADAPRLGTVGPPIDGTQLRIDEDGEILCKGPQVMKGYYQNEEATREAFTEDGWLRTGDIGALDEDGYLSITDRKKEILVNSYGKNIAPSPVEEAVKRSRYVEHAVLIGDQRKFPIVLLQPAFEALEGWAGEQGLSPGDREGLVEDDRVRELLEEEVAERVRDFPDHERPREVLPVAEEFAVESGELTPTMKVKRRVITDRYDERIEETYRRAIEEWEGRRADRAEAGPAPAS